MDDEDEDEDEDEDGMYRFLSLNTPLHIWKKRMQKRTTQHNTY